MRFFRILFLNRCDLPEPAARLEISKVIHDLFDGSVDAFEILLIEGAAFVIALDNLQPFKDHVVEIGRERLLFQAKFGLIGSFR